MPRKAENTPRIAILKNATRDAIEAIGSLDLAAGEASVGKSQLGRCQSINDVDTLSLRDAVTLDELSRARGGPFILPAFARLLNHVVVERPQAEPCADGMAASVMKITCELGDVVRCFTDGSGEGGMKMGQIAAVEREVDELEQAIAAFRLKLDMLKAEARK